MKVPVQIIFQNMRSSAMIEEWIRAESARLETSHNPVMSCRVAIGIPHRSHKNGKPLHVRIDLALPGKRIVIEREPVASLRPRTICEGDALVKLHRMPPHHDLHVVIHDAFKAAARRIHDFARNRRGNRRVHEQIPRAIVRRIIPEEGFGFLEAEDGRAIYFQENSVHGNGFHLLKVGKPVSFSEELGEKGPQATTVWPIPAMGSQARQDLTA